MIQEDDDRRIENLKRELHMNKKIDVIRAGLAKLEEEARRLQRIKRWRRAVKLVADNSAEINKEFQSYSRIKQSDDHS